MQITSSSALNTHVVHGKISGPGYCAVIERSVLDIVVLLERADIEPDKMNDECKKAANDHGGKQSTLSYPAWIDEVVARIKTAHPDGYQRGQTWNACGVVATMTGWFVSVVDYHRAKKARDNLYTSLRIGQI